MVARMAQGRSSESAVSRVFQDGGSVTESRIIDAYRYPRRIRPGCLHQLGCKCDPPYWLREPSPQEFARWFKPLPHVEEASP